MTYTVDESYVRVWMWSYTVRRIALSDIDYAARDWAFWNECRTGTLDSKKVVFLRRRAGMFKNVLISPMSPMDFLRERGAHGVVIRVHECPR